MIKATCDGKVTEQCGGEVTHTHSQIPDRHYCTKCATMMNNIVGASITQVIDAGSSLISYRAKLTIIRFHAMQGLEWHATIDPDTINHECALWPVWCQLLGCLGLIESEAAEALVKGVLN